jgi:hypothetical protein
MTQSELEQAIQAGKVEQLDPTPKSDSQNTPGINLSDTAFLPLLQSLLSPRRPLSAPPTFTPKNFLEQIQYVEEGSDFSLYLYLDGYWRSQTLGVIQQPPLTLEAASIQVTVLASTNSDTPGGHTFGFVPKMVFGTMSGGGTTTVNYFGLWVDGQHNQTSIASDGHGPSTSQFVGADDGLYLRNLSVSGTTLDFHYKNTGTSDVTVTLWVLGSSS